MRVDGRNLRLTVGGATDLQCDSTSVLLDNEPADADLVTFADVIAGNDRRWFLTITALPDFSGRPPPPPGDTGPPGLDPVPAYGAGTFWELLWSTPAYTPIAYILNPHGVDVPTNDQPWFVGEATVDQKPPIGGAAASPWTFDARLTCTAPPTRQTT